MKNKLLVPIFLLGLCSISAQEAVVASGGNATGDGSVSYSIGQLVFASETTDGGSVSQGVQHPIDVYTLDNTNPTPLTLSTKVYPNPTSDVLVLVFSDHDDINCGYELYDVTGKRVAQGQTAVLQTQISLKNLMAGTYTLRVHQNNQLIQSFRIIKN